MADLDAVLAAAGLGAQRDRFAPSWPSCGGTAAAHDPEFLTPAAVDAAARLIALPEAHRTALQEGLALFADRPALRALAAHGRWLFVEGAALPGPGGWPMLDADLHPQAPLFWAYVVLACAEQRIERNRRDRGIDEATTRAGFGDLARWMDAYHRACGRWGFDRAGWLYHHVQGTLIELGRLQCGLNTWNAELRVFRHRRDRRVAILLMAGAEMRADGRPQGVVGLPPDPDGWVSAFAEDAAGWRGNAVDVRGRALRQETVLPAADYELVLAQGDPIWYVHIPAGSALTPEACRVSLIAHRERLPRWFPEHRARAFISVSWMFDAQLADYLPADANLVRFQRAFHLHPHRDLSGEQIRERVLGSTQADWRTFEPRNSLQKAVVEHYRAGGTWSQSGAVMLPDEVEAAFG